MKNNSSIKINKVNKTITVIRKNVSKTNAPDTRYVNLKVGTEILIRILMKKGFKLFVHFLQYTTLENKLKNRPKFSIKIEVNKFTKLGLRTKTKSGEMFFRYRLENKKEKKLNLETELSNFNSYSISIGTAFSGLGCPEYVLKNKLNVNHTSEFVIDNNKYCRQTLKTNFNPKMILEDITKIDTSKLPSTELYVWGSPCQNFSMAASASIKGRQGLSGETGILFWDGFKILKDTQPKYSIFENVKGLVNHDNGNTFKTIINAFKSLSNYEIYHKVINPIDIGGNTNRERIFITLIRKDINLPFNFPENVDNNTNCIKDVLIDGDYKYLDKKDLIPFKIPLNKQRGKLKIDFLWTRTKREADQRVFNINYPAPTITRTCHLLIYDNKGVRNLSIEELKKIQGFGDDMIFKGLSNAQIKSQLGNTMEVTTIEKLIGEIIRIDKLHKLINSKNSVNNINYNGTNEEKIA